MSRSLPNDLPRMFLRVEGEESEIDHQQNRDADHDDPALRLQAEDAAQRTGEQRDGDHRETLVDMLGVAVVVDDPVALYLI